MAFLATTSSPPPPLPPPPPPATAYANIKNENIFNKLIRDKANDKNCPDIHLPAAQFKPQDYNNILSVNNDNINDQKNDGTAITKRIHMVHISDTHMRHKNLVIPFKKDSVNILIHTGDFTQRAKLIDNKLPNQVSQFLQWFKNQPHHKKVIICGNHEIAFNPFTKDQIKKHVFKQTDNIHYLQDDGINLFGINFYGSPWTSSTRMGFSAKQDILRKKWKLIPNNTNILLTHMPPNGILDTACKDSYNFQDICKICNYYHPHYRHWGNIDLLNEVTNRIKPQAHLYGHVHQGTGYRKYKNVLFVNSATDLFPVPHEFDVVFDL